MDFFVVPKKPKPVRLLSFVNRLIRQAQGIAHDALTIETPPDTSPYITNYALGLLVNALRDAATEIEAMMAQHATERRAEHQRALDARRNGGEP